MEHLFRDCFQTLPMFPYLGSEFGDVENVWQSILKEGRCTADIHFRISSKLGLNGSEGIVKKIYEYGWQAMQFLKPLFSLLVIK